jgi:hypothetical protein
MQDGVVMIEKKKPYKPFFDRELEVHKTLKEF